MWQRKTLRHSNQTRHALTQSLQGEAVAFDLNVKGSKMGVHNWTHGIETLSGRYLSPQNAVQALSAKFTDFADPNRPKGSVEVVVIMLTAPNGERFCEKLKSVKALLPEPCFKQAYDYANAAATLAYTKMVKTPQIAHPAFSVGGDITPQSGRTLNKAMQTLKPPTAGGDMFAKLAEMKRQKAQKQAEATAQIEEMLNASAEVYAFIARGELAQIAPQLLQNVPEQANTFTACLCLIGEDLTQIKEMLNEPE